MLDLAAACRVRMVLSGTPMPQSPLDLYTQLNVLWPKQELTGSRTAFKARADNDFPGLVEALQPIFTRTSKAALNIPPYEVVHLPCEMPPLQAELSELIENRFRRVLTDAAEWPWRNWPCCAKHDLCVFCRWRPTLTCLTRRTASSSYLP